jgi:hypothetical protein
MSNTTPRFFALSAAGKKLSFLHDIGELAAYVRRARVAMGQDVAGTQQVEDLRHQLGRFHAADMAHHFRAGACKSHARIARRSGSRPCFAMTFSDILTLMPMTMSAFSREL